MHALNQFDRRQFRIRAAVGSPPDKDFALRIRVIGAAVVWALAVVVLMVVAEPAFWTPLRFPAILAASFLALWTVWLLRLLQRLSVKNGV